MSGPGRSCRSRPTTPPTTRCMPRSASLDRDGRRASTRRRRGAGASSASAPRRSGCSKAPPTRTASSSLVGRDRHLHHAGLSLPGGRHADDQFPPAALDAVHAGLGLFRAGDACRRPMRTRSKPAIASIPMAMPACCSGPTTMTDDIPVHASSPPTARRGAARSRCRAATIRTPAFMPVGTAGTVKAMYLDQVRDARRRHHPRQHLSPDAAARAPSAWRGSAACTNSRAGRIRS